jgi:DNA-binding FadR family transcriptional regulator
MAAGGPVEVIDHLLGSPVVAERDAGPIGNTRFHVAIAEASGNLVLARVIETLNERLAAEHQLMETDDGSERLTEGHDRIVEALRRRDRSAAEEAARRHIEFGRDVLAHRVREGSPFDA